MSKFVARKRLKHKVMSETLEAYCGCVPGTICFERRRYKEILEEYKISMKEVEEEMKKLNTEERRKKLLSKIKRKNTGITDEDLLKDEYVCLKLNKIILSISLSNLVKNKLIN